MRWPRPWVIPASLLHLAAALMEEGASPAGRLTNWAVFELFPARLPSFQRHYSGFSLGLHSAHVCFGLKLLIISLGQQHRAEVPSFWGLTELFLFGVALIDWFTFTWLFTLKVAVLTSSSMWMINTPPQKKKTSYTCQFCIRVINSHITLFLIDPFILFTFISKPCFFFFCSWSHPQCSQ